MTKRFAPLLLAGVVCLAGLALADEPAGQDQPPVRLKKKKPRGDDKPMTEPGKADEKNKDEKKKDRPKAENREAEPVTQQEEEKEVFQRVIKNAHNVEERLAKNDLGEGTRQTQRDILKDIESLIHRSENPPPQSGQQQEQQNGGGGGGSEDQDRMQNKEQQGQKGQQGKSGQKSQGKSGGSKSGGSRAGGQPGAGKQSGGKQPGGKQPNGQQPGGQRAGGKQPGEQKQDGKDGSGKQPGGENGKNGNGGGGGGKSERAMNRNADLYKDVWGHLPEALRARMDAYSNPQSFLPKYDDLIKRYYRTIAEQGRRKGE
jgi:hypothetical protein